MLAIKFWTAPLLDLFQTAGDPGQGFNARIWVDDVYILVCVPSIGEILVTSIEISNRLFELGLTIMKDWKLPIYHIDWDLGDKKL